jgi:hypothetical protein
MSLGGKWLITGNIGAEHQGKNVALSTALALVVGLCLDSAHQSIPVWRTTSQVENYEMFKYPCKFIFCVVLLGMVKQAW